MKKLIKLIKLIKLTAITTAIIAISGCKTTPPPTAQDMEISNVYQVEGNTKDKIYNQVQIWMSQNYNSSKEVIQYTSKEDGVIVGNGRIKYPCEGFECIAKEKWNVEYTAQVDIKDNRFRISFTNLEVSYPASYSLGVASPAGGFKLWDKDDFIKLRSVLLGQGESMKASFSNTSTKSDW